MFPSLELDSAELRPLSTEITHDELVESVRTQAEPASGIAREVMLAAAEAGNSIVIVHCTCGHLYVIDI